MPITALDPNVALLVVDLQKGIVGYATVHPIADVLERSARLAASFRKNALPVVLVNVGGRATGRTDAAPRVGNPAPDWMELAPELDARPDDLRVTKTRWGAFTGTSLDADLKALGVTQVVVTGVATSAGVESTARFAHELGYNVVLAVDAMTDMDLAVHTNSVERIFPRIGEVATTDRLLELLKR